MHLTTATRPDIAFAVGYVSRFMENPQVEHWIAVKRTFAICKGPRRMESASSSVTKLTFVGTLMQIGLEITVIASRLQATCSF